MSKQALPGDRSNSVGPSLPSTHTRILQENVPVPPTTPSRKMSRVDLPASPRSISTVGSFIESGIANLLTIRRLRPSELCTSAVEEEDQSEVERPALSQDVGSADFALPLLPPSLSSSRSSSIAEHVPLPSSLNSSTESVWGSPRIANDASPAFTTIRHVRGPDTPSSVERDSSGIESTHFYTRESPLRYTQSPESMDINDLARRDRILGPSPLKGRSLRDELKKSRRSPSSTTIPRSRGTSINSSSNASSFGGKLKETFKHVKHKGSRAFQNLRGSKYVTDSEDDRRQAEHYHASGSVPAYFDPANPPQSLPTRRGGCGIRDFHSLRAPAPKRNGAQAFLRQYLHEQASKPFYTMPNSNIASAGSPSPPPLPPRHPMHTYVSPSYQQPPVYTACSTASVSVASSSTSSGNTFSIANVVSPQKNSHRFDALLDRLPLNDNVQIEIALKDFLRKTNSWFQPPLRREQRNLPAWA